MSYWQFKVTWFQKTSSDPPEWDGTGVDITDLINLKETESISEGKTIKQDTFKFVVSLTDTDGDGFGNKPQQFGNDDLVQIKVSRDGGAFTTIMDGKIQTIDYHIEAGKRIAIINGLNRTQSLLRSLITLDINDSKPPMAIKAILAEVNENNNIAGASGNQIKYVYYDEDSSTYKDQDGSSSSAANLTIQRQQGDIVSQRAGTSQPEFSSISRFNSWFDNGYEAVVKISSGDITNDGNYIFYVDSQNNFWWQSKPTTNAGTLTEGDQILTLKIKQDIDNVTNFFAIHCGTGPTADYGILTYQYNDESIARHGLKAKFFDMTSMADTLMKIEKQFGGTNKPTDASYPFPAAYNYTTTFTASGSYLVGGVAKVRGDALTATSDSDWQDIIEGEAKRRAETYAKRVLDVMGVGTWEATVTIKGDASYNKGQLLYLEVGTLGWIGDDVKELRIHEISHNLSKNGWTTDLTLKEDEESAI